MRSMPHVCTIEETTSGSFIQPMSGKVHWYKKIIRRWRKLRMVSSKDPRVIEFYRTKTGLLNERKRHSTSGQLYIIHPFSDFKHVHEIVMCLFLFVSLLLFPFLHSFYYVERYDKLTMIGLNAVFLPDIILTFFMGYADTSNRKVIMDPKKIARHYILGYFFFDVISALPTDTIAYTCSSPYFIKFNVLRLIRLVRIGTFLEYMKRILIRYNCDKAVLFGIRYVLMSALILHWFTCTFHFVPYVRRNIQGKLHNESWVVLEHIETKQLKEKYVTTLFKSAGLLVAAHYDMFRSGTHQIYPTEELITAIIIMLFGKIYVALSAVVFVSLVFEKYTLETKYQCAMSQLHEYMKNKKLPMTMRERLVQYYDHKFQKRFFKDKVITAILSENLRKEVNINVCKQLVRSVKLFSDLPQNIIADILGNLKGEIFLPNDIIIKAGSYADCMYFLASGTVAILTPSGREVCHLEDGSYFGEIALIVKDSKRSTDVIALEVCEVYRLDKKAFKACFKNDKSGVLEKMQQIAEARMERTATLEENYKLELFQKAYLRET